MPTVFNDSQYAIAESTFAVSVAFFDEMEVPVIPGTASWSLVNELGVTVNNRLDVPITALASSVHIMLTGDDLVFADGCSRTLIVKGTYDSSLGTGLSIADSLRFKIYPLYSKKGC